MVIEIAPADAVATLTAIVIILLAANLAAGAARARPLTPDPPDAPGRTVRWLTQRPSARRATGMLVLATATVVLGPLLTATLTTTGFVAVRMHPWRAQRRQRAKVERVFPDVVDLLIITIRAGSTPRQAVDAIAAMTSSPCAPAFAEVLRRTRRGQSFADALAALAESLGPRAAPVADAMASCERYGLPLEPMLDQLSAEARASRRRLDQTDARKLPVRLSFPLVACTLPSFVLLAIAPAVIAALSSLGADAW